MSNMEASPTPTTDDTPQVVGDGAATLPSRPPTLGKIKPIRKASEVTLMVQGVKDLLMRMYEAYKKEEPAAAQSTAEANVESGGEVRVECNDPRLKKFARTRKDRSVVQIKNEVDKYLLEAAQDPEIADFDLLDWWRENSPRFPVLSKIARDVFAVPVSSVPSEAAFSMGKRVVDPFRGL
ncbi:unnamed protein product [Prunus brigantina]